MSEITPINNILTLQIKNKVDDIIKKNVYPGPQQVLSLIKKDFPLVRLKDIQKYLLTKKEYQLTFERKQVKKSMGHIVAFAPYAICQIDIFDMSKYAYDYSQYKSKKKVDGIKTNRNKGYKYIFCLIDVFSRWVDLIMMKTKSMEETTNALKIILDSNKINPFTLISDSDKAFLGKDFQTLLKERNITLEPVIVDDHRALGVIDRFARTLKTRLTKLFLANNDSQWVDELSNVQYSYNNNPNKGILYYTPEEVLHDPKASEDILQHNFIKSAKNDKLNAKSTITAGDKVRLYIDNPMRKGTEPNYTTDIYIVKSKIGKKITLTNGKRILDHNVLKISDGDSGKMTSLEASAHLAGHSPRRVTDGQDDMNVIDEANLENRKTRLAEKATGKPRLTYEELNEPRPNRIRRKPEKLRD